MDSLKLLCDLEMQWQIVDISFISFASSEFDSSSITSREDPQTDGTIDGIQHCHDNSHSREDREREKKVARKRLYVASVICVIFMTGEILGEFSCLKVHFY